jgi:hypothetical protein
MASTRAPAKRTDGQGGYWYAEAEGRYRARFTDAAGNSRTLSAPTEEESVRKLEKRLDQRDRGILGLAPGQTSTLGQWLDQWLVSRPDLSPKSP